MMDNQKTYAEAMNEYLANTNDIINQSKELEKEIAIKTTQSVLSRLKQVEEKNRCLRVRILDWLSDTFHRWGDACHKKSVQINSPCAIKLPKSGDE